MKADRETCSMFKQMKITQKVYKGKLPSKRIIREDANRDSRVRKRKGQESASPTNPKKGNTEKCKKKIKSL